MLEEVKFQLLSRSFCVKLYLQFNVKYINIKIKYDDDLVMMMVVMPFRPPGVFEWDNFNKGTQGVLEAVVNATKRGATTIVGNIDLCVHLLSVRR